MKNLLKNRAEMFSYNLIATASSLDSLKHVCNIDWDLYPSDEEKSLISEALRIHQVIRSGNFVEFFRTLRRPFTNYFFACVMLIQLDAMRRTAMESLVKSYFLTGMPYSLVKTKLNLPTE